MADIFWMMAAASDRGCGVALTICEGDEPIYRLRAYGRCSGSVFVSRDLAEMRTIADKLVHGEPVASNSASA